jgi:hypothetical protein
LLGRELTVAAERSSGKGQPHAAFLLCSQPPASSLLEAGRKKNYLARKRSSKEGTERKETKGAKSCTLRYRMVRQEVEETKRPSTERSWGSLEGYFKE